MAVILLLVSGMPLGGGVVGAAETAGLSTTSGSASYLAGGGAVVVDPQVTVSGDDIDGAQVFIVDAKAAGDELTWDTTVATNNGVSGTYDSNSGVLTFTADGESVSATAMQAVLRTVAYHNTGDPGDTDRTVRFVLGDKPYYSGTDHVYDPVVGQFTWTEARDAPGTYYGQNGYLVTITSEGENDFVAGTLAEDSWIGLAEREYTGAPRGMNPCRYTASVWEWQSGPETGDAIFYSTIRGWVGTSAFTNWGRPPNEPRLEQYNGGCIEDYAIIFVDENKGWISANDGTWRDAYGSSERGYVAEYPAVTADRTMTMVSGPTVTGVTRQTPADQTTNADELSFRVSFSTNVTGVDPDDVSLTTVSGDVGTAVDSVSTVSASEYDVTVTLGAGEGEVRLDVTDTDGDVTDSAGNSLQGDFASGETYVIDDTDAPGFQSGTTASIDEESTGAVLEVNAVDDAGDGDDEDDEYVTYALSSAAGNDADGFTIDTDTGQLSLDTAKDHESPVDADGDSVYELTVEATDDGGNTVTQGVNVTVADVNDPPADLSLDSTTVTQSAGSDALVGTLSATDDDDDGDPLAYSLATGDGDDANDRFNIDGTALEASATNTMPAGEYGIRVGVADGNGGTAEQTFSITIEDDISPQITSVTITDATDDNGLLTAGDQLTIEATVTDTTGVNSVTADASAFDAGTVTLTATGGDTYHRTVSVGESPTEGDQSLTVSATDTESNGGGQAVRTGTLTVDITPPTTSDDTATASEDTTGTQLVTDLRANDEDAVSTETDLEVTAVDGNSNNVATAVTGTNGGQFTVTTDGEVTFDAAGDFESLGGGEAASTSVAVTVADEAGNEATEMILTTVQGVNDAPTDLSLADTIVSQSAGSDAPVGALSATDQDGDALAYSLATSTGDADNDLFAIDGTTLEAATAGAMPAGTYDVRIAVADNNGGTAEQVFSITVEDDVEPDVIGVTIIDATDGNGLLAAGDQLTIEATVTDVTSVESVTADASAIDAGIVTLTQIGGNTFNKTVAVGERPTEGEQSLMVSATDTESNGGGQAVTSGIFTVDTTPPTTSDDTGAASEDVRGVQLLTDLRANDEDAVSADTDLKIIAVGGNAGDVATAVAGTNGGQFTVTATGEVTFDAAGDFESLSGGATASTSVTATVADEAGNDVPQTVTATVEGVNDAPTLSVDARSLGIVFEDDVDNEGTAIKTVLQSSGSAGDADGDTLGVAVVSADDTDGRWEYSTDGGASWEPVASALPATESTLLLADTDRVRFVPAADFSGDAAGTVTIRAWDQTEGTSGDTETATTSAGGSSPFSTNSTSIGITVAEAPEVVAIERISGQFSPPNPTNASAVEYDVRFSADVTGVDMSDFTVNSVSGDVSGSVSAVSPTGPIPIGSDDDPPADTYTVRVDSITGDGDLRLDLVDDGSITNGNGVELGGVGTVGGADGGYTAGQTVTIDNTAPAFSSDAAPTIDEGTTGGVVVVDAGDDGTAHPDINITYALSSAAGSDADGFSIDTDTGQLSLGTIKDHENPDDADGDSVYELTVVATDDVGNTATQTIAITVGDINDPPTGLVLDDITVAQSAGIDAPVGRLSATDQDGDALSYSMVTGDGDTDNGAFSVNGSTLQARNASTLRAGDYSVRTEVADGNGGTDEEVFSVTAVDDVEPQVSSVTLIDATDGNGIVATGDTLAVEAVVTDVTGVEVAMSGLSAFDAPPIDLTQVGANTYRTTVFVGESPIEGNQSVTVNATDVSGNGGTQAVVSGTLVVDTTPPTTRDDVRTASEDATTEALIADLRVNDTDDVSASSGLKITAVGGNRTGVAAPVPGTNGGRFTITADGRVLFDGNADFESLDSGETNRTRVSVTLADEAGNEATQTVTAVVDGVTDDTGGGGGSSASIGRATPSSSPTQASTVSLQDVYGGQRIVVDFTRQQVTTSVVPPADASAASGRAQTSIPTGDIRNVQSDGLVLTVADRGDYDLTVTARDVDVFARNTRSTATDAPTNTDDVASDGDPAGDVASSDADLSTDALGEESRQFVEATARRPVGFITVDHTFEPDDLETATHRFRVRKSYLAATGATAESVTLYRDGPDGYRDLPTREVDADETFHYFEAETPGFSTFVIGTDAPVFDLGDPALVTADETSGRVEATVPVENVGTHAGTYTARLRGDDTVLATTTVSVPPGETVTARVQTTLPDAAGVPLSLAGGSLATVSSGGQETVAEADDEPSDSSSPLVAVGIALLVLAVLAVVILGTWRRTEPTDDADDESPDDVTVDPATETPPAAADEPAPDGPERAACESSLDTPDGHTSRPGETRPADDQCSGASDTDEPDADESKVLDSPHTTNATRSTATDDSSAESADAMSGADYSSETDESSEER